MVKLAYCKKKKPYGMKSHIYIFFPQIFLVSYHLRSSVCWMFCKEDICPVLCAEFKFVGPSK